MTEPKFFRMFEVGGSDLVKGMAYDPMTQTLDVEFHKGGIYRYSMVSHLEFCMLITADSAGKAFIAIIRDKKKFEKTSKVSLLP